MDSRITVYYDNGKDRSLTVPLDAHTTANIIMLDNAAASEEGVLRYTIQDDLKGIVLDLHDTETGDISYSQINGSTTHQPLWSTKATHGQKHSHTEPSKCRCTPKLTNPGEQVAFAEFMSMNMPRHLLDLIDLGVTPDQIAQALTMLLDITAANRRRNHKG